MSNYLPAWTGVTVSVHPGEGCLVQLLLLSICRKRPKEIRCKCIYDLTELGTLIAGRFIQLNITRCFPQLFPTEQYMIMQSGGKMGR